jgi:hypothetical protein
MNPLNNGSANPKCSANQQGPLQKDQIQQGSVQQKIDEKIHASGKSKDDNQIPDKLHLNKQDTINAQNAGKDFNYFDTHKLSASECVINLPADINLAREQIKSIIQSGPYKQPHSIILNLSKCDEFTDADMKLIVEVLKCFPNLRSLVIDQNNSTDNLTPEGYLHLANALRKSRFLETVKLSLNLEQQPQKSFTIVMESLKYLSNLEKLTLELFTSHDFDVQWIRDFAKNIQRHKSLSELSLFISNYPRFHDEHVNSLTNCLQQLVNLKKLKLEIRVVDMDLKDFKKITTVVQRLKHLKSLCLNFPDSQFESINTNCRMLKDCGVKEDPILISKLNRLWEEEDVCDIFANTIQSLPNLTSLILSFYATSELTDDKYQKILDSIADLQYLSEIGLNLYGDSKITDQFIKSLANTIQRYKLKSLEFTFGNVQKLSNAGLSKLARTIKKSWRTLSECSIRIGKSSNQQKEGIAELFASIGDLQLLTKLALGVHGVEITNDSLKQIAESLAKVNCLKVLDINLFPCQQIDDKGIDYLVNKLKDLHSLTELGVILEKGTQVTNNTLDSLTTCLADLHELTQVEVWLNSKNVTSEAKDKFIEQLSIRLEKHKHIEIF